jgi:hypothetical protein
VLLPLHWFEFSTEIWLIESVKILLLGSWNHRRICVLSGNYFVAFWPSWQLLGSLQLSSGDCFKPVRVR